MPTTRVFYLQSLSHLSDSVTLHSIELGCTIVFSCEVCLYYLPTYLPTYLLPTYLPTYLPTTYLLPTYLPTYLNLPTYYLPTTSTCEVLVRVAAAYHPAALLFDLMVRAPADTPAPAPALR